MLAGAMALGCAHTPAARRKTDIAFGAAAPGVLVTTVVRFFVYTACTDASCKGNGGT